LIQFDFRSSQLNVFVICLCFTVQDDPFGIDEYDGGVRCLVF